MFQRWLFIETWNINDSILPRNDKNSENKLHKSKNYLSYTSTHDLHIREKTFEFQRNDFDRSNSYLSSLLKHNLDISLLLSGNQVTAWGLLSYKIIVVLMHTTTYISLLKNPLMTSRVTHMLNPYLRKTVEILM